MLLNLHVKNLALIEEAEVEFGTGLNILTGETGAGKSILIGAVSVGLGGKVSKDLVRKGADYGLAELVFLVENDMQRELLQKMEIEIEEDQVILTRKVTGGRSICKVNGETVTVSTLKKLAEVLIDLHGQHEHQSLLHKKKHLEIVDEFGGAEIEKLRNEVESLYKQYKELEEEIKNSSMDEEQRQREISFAQFEVNEIEEAGLKPGEDDALEELYKRMMNGRKIKAAAAFAVQLTGNDGPDGASDSVGRAVGALLELKDYDEALVNLYNQISQIEDLLTDFHRELSDYMTELEFSEEEFSETEERLDKINHLKSKYGNSMEDILSYAEEKKETLSKLEQHEVYVEELQKKQKALEKKLLAASKKLSEKRKKNASVLEGEITKHLVDLNFLDVKFEVSFQKVDHFTAGGIDQIEFLISTNPGEKPRALGEVASGGELSRIMLAIKTVLADKDNIGTLIFDEIDAGISGRTAQKVSEKMNVIGKKRQVICITHLPQIAAMADHHFMIEKTTKNNHTKTNIRPLKQNEMVEELSRIIGGAEITETMRNSAKEMKDLAERTKTT